jgi:outer membrane protein TolC
MLVSAATTPFAVAQQSAPAEQQTLQLSLDEAVKRALENNADIVVARYDPQLSEQTVRGALGYYDPYLTGTYTRSSSDAKGTNAFSGGAAVNTKQDVWNLAATVPVAPTGGSVQLGFNNSRVDTNNSFTSFNPVFNSRLTLTLTQPLLQNLLIDSPREQLRIAKKNREISDVQFHATIVNTVAGVKGAYYDLIYALDNLAAARKSQDLASRLLNENQIRVKVGTMAPLDIVTAQAEVASREEGVIVAENAVGNAEDNLKQAIFPANDLAMWATRIEPTDRPTAEPVPVDVAAAVRSALENRTDVVAARKGLERSDISLSYARNQLLPDLNLVASYGAAGAGGTQLIRDPELGGPVVSTVPGGYGDALSEVFGRDFPTWSVGLNLAYAIPNRSAKAAAAQARIGKDQALASFRRLELSVAAEVRTAARGVESGFKRVGTTQAARTLAAQRLDAEEKKFAAGMSTNFLVMQAQRDLATAEVAELQAIADYRKSVINYQRVQEAGLTGGGSTVTLSTGSSAQSSAALRSGQASSSVQSSTSGF